MHRFFIDPGAVTGSIALLTGPEAHHLRAVLRLAAGDRICLFDGTGRTHEAAIRLFRKNDVELEILATRLDPPPAVRLEIGQALLKGKKMELVIQKANELGIDTLAPFLSENCEGRLPEPEKTERWQRIAIESCKQCGRPTPMRCRPAGEFAALLAGPGHVDLKLIFWEQETEHSLRRTLDEFPFSGRAGLAAQALIGPEGGFSRTEIDQALAAGFQPVSLGRRILRAETASLAVMAILQYSFGNLD